MASGRMDQTNVKALGTFVCTRRHVCINQSIHINHSSSGTLLTQPFLVRSSLLLADSSKAWLRNPFSLKLSMCVREALVTQEWYHS